MRLLVSFRSGQGPGRRGSKTSVLPSLHFASYTQISHRVTQLLSDFSGRALKKFCVSSENHNSCPLFQGKKQIRRFVQTKQATTSCFWLHNKIVSKCEERHTPGEGIATVQYCKSSPRFLATESSLQQAGVQLWMSGRALSGGNN